MEERYGKKGSVSLTEWLVKINELDTIGMYCFESKTVIDELLFSFEFSGKSVIKFVNLADF